jgi:hypothetical protein
MSVHLGGPMSLFRANVPLVLSRSSEREPPPLDHGVLLSRPAYQAHLQVAEEVGITEHALHVRTCTS